MREGTLKQLNVKVGDKVRPIKNSFSGNINGVLLVLTHVDHTYCYCSARRADREEPSWQVSYDSTIFRLEGEAVEIKAGDEVIYKDGLDDILCKVIAAENYWAVINYQGGPPWVVNKADLGKPKPKPVVKEVVTYGRILNDYLFGGSEKDYKDTHKITFNLVDGEPDCNSIKMEKL